MLPLRKVTNKHLGELLIERKIINKEDLESALITQKDKGGLIGETLVQMGVATEEDIAQALTSQYGFPYLPLGSYEIDQEVLKAVPHDVCVRHCLIPVDIIGNSLTIAMSNPLDHQAIDEIEKITNCTVQLYVSTPTDIRQALAKYHAGK